MATPNPQNQSMQGFNPRAMYDVGPNEMRLIKERAKMRDALKKEWVKKVTSPYRGVGGYIVSALHNFMNVKSKTLLDFIYNSP